MFNRLFKRNWISPFVAIAFVAVGVSGVLMLFHIRIPGMRHMHEYMGALLAFTGALHAMLNWKPFTFHFRTRAAFLALIAGVIICATLVFWGITHPRRYGPPPRTDNIQVPAAAENQQPR